MRTESRHPLSWPAGWQRAKHRSRAMFGRKGSKGWKESLTVGQAVERVRANAGEPCCGYTGESA